jgi:hypothetical protein
MIDKDIKYADRKNFGGGSDMGTVADSSGNVGPSKGGYQGGGTNNNQQTNVNTGNNNQQTNVNTGNNNDIVMENIGSPGIEDIMSGNFAEFGPVTYGAPSIFNPMSGVYAPTNMMFKNMQTLDRFTKYRPDVPSIPGISNVLNAIGLNVPNPLQGLSDFTTAKNRDFFQDVIRAGKIPGLNFSTLSDMSDQQLEDAYQSYMTSRLAGNIDAYGNPIISTEGGSDNPLQNLLLAKQAAQEPQENLQGGVAQLYNQYLQNLGSL